MTSTTVVIDTDWRLRGNCAALTDPDTMHPHPGNSRGIAEAKAVCRGCIVQPECLAWADGQDIRHGIWAGKTPAERGRPTKQPGVTIPPRKCDDCGGEFRSNRASQRRCPECSRKSNPAAFAAPAWLLARGDEIAALKREGTTDKEIAARLGTSQSTVTVARKNLGIGTDGIWLQQPVEVAA